MPPPYFRYKSICFKSCLCKFTLGLDNNKVLSNALKSHNSCFAQHKNGYLYYINVWKEFYSLKLFSLRSTCKYPVYIAIVYKSFYSARYLYIGSFENSNYMAGANAINKLILSIKKSLNSERANVPTVVP